MVAFNTPIVEKRKHYMSSGYTLLYNAGEK